MGAETYSPKWAPHVTGTFTLVTGEDGIPEPCDVALACAACGDTHQHRCTSGMPRQWILRYAQAHVHRDALKDPFPKQRSRT